MFDWFKKKKETKKKIARVLGRCLSRVKKLEIDINLFNNFISKHNKLRFALANKIKADNIAKLRGEIFEIRTFFNDFLNVIDDFLLEESSSDNPFEQKDFRQIREKIIRIKKETKAFLQAFVYPSEVESKSKFDKLSLSSARKFDISSIILKLTQIKESINKINATRLIEVEEELRRLYEQLSKLQKDLKNDKKNYLRYFYFSKSMVTNAKEGLELINDIISSLDFSKFKKREETKLKKIGDRALIMRNEIEDIILKNKMIVKLSGRFIFDEKKDIELSEDYLKEIGELTQMIEKM
jgi:hypothetical protein